jgi:hypothetical protein
MDLSLLDREIDIVVREDAGKSLGHAAKLESHAFNLPAVQRRRRRRSSAPP